MRGGAHTARGESGAMRRMVSIGLVAVLGLVLCATATAAGERESARRTAKQAPGQLELTGTGAVTLNGQLTAFGVIPEAGGSLVVQDQRGDATVTLNGARQPLRSRRLNLRKAQGAFFVKGTKVNVRVQGNNVSLSAAGRGRASVAGIGTFTLNGADSQEWPPGYGIIELLPPAS
jgi:uncharacterized lipoprotein NlpE involved in copper resistance